MSNSRHGNELLIFAYPMFFANTKACRQLLNKTSKGLKGEQGHGFV